MSHPSLIIAATANTDLTPWIPFSRKSDHPDVIHLNTAEEGITIDQVREWLASMLERPYVEAYRIFFIHAAHQANIVAQNALLKIIEEPPHHIQCILLTSTPNLLLATIRSRCQIIAVDHPTDSQTTNSIDFAAPLTTTLQWLETFSGREEALTLTYDTLRATKKLLEGQPSHVLIHRLQRIQQTITMLHANVSPKLCLEWLVLQERSSTPSKSAFSAH